MFGRKDYTQEELDHARAAVDRQLEAYRTLTKAVRNAGADSSVDTAMRALEAELFTAMVLVLDRYFVHRLRMVTGKDGNPLNEVELLADSLMNNDAVLRGSTVIKLVPEQSVAKVNVGDRIRLSQEDFERLASAFFAEIECKFVKGAG